MLQKLNFNRIIDDVTRLFTRILTTKLFPDIIEEMIACMAAFCGSLSQHCRELFNWMFDLYNSSVSDETRIVILKSLVKIIENGGKGIKDNVMNLLNKLKDALEDAESIELLLTVTDVVLISAKAYPNLLQQHFRDIVDILVGWLLDSTQSAVMTKPLEDALISLKDFWHFDIEFSATLLGQFIEDFENFYQNLMDESGLNLFQPKSPTSRSRSANENLSSDDRILKMASLVRVYVTVLKSLEKFKSQELTPTITWDFLSEALKTIIKRVNSVIAFKHSEDLVIATNECSRLTIESVHSVSTQSKQLMVMLGSEMLQYLVTIQESFESASDKYIITSLNLIKTVVKEINVELPVDFVSKILNYGSHCQKLRFLPSNQIQKALFSLHHSILAIKSVPILEEAYRCLLLDIKVAFTVLLDTKLDLLDNNISPSIEYTYSEEEAILSVQSSLVSLAEIANTKHSIIGMWALKPSFIDLIIQHLNPANELLSSKYKTIHYSLLYILYSHSHKHSHFISSSSLISLMSSPPNSANISLISSSTTSGLLFNSSMITHSSNHLSNTLNLLSSVVKHKGLLIETLLLCINWTIEVLESSQSHLQSLSTSKEFISLIENIADLTFSKDIKVCLLSCKVIESVLKSVPDIVLPTAFDKYNKACHLHIGHTDVNVQKEYTNLLAILPSVTKSQNIETTVTTDLFSKKEGFIYPEEVRTAIVALMQRDPSTSFSSTCFRAIISFILEKGQQEDENWLWRWFHCCLSDDNPIKSSQMMAKSNLNYSNQIDITQVIDSHKSALIFWSCWEVVQYCITNKLRTPLGKPQDTFTKIEAAIKTRVAQIQSSSSETNDFQSTSALQVRMLLLLMENMEKLVYNAIDGNSSRLYSTPKNSKSFFRTNKATCAEWINRNRRSIMLIALKCGEPATVVRHGQELLREIINSKNQNNNDFEFILLLIIEALIQLEAADAAMGYYIWAKQTFGSKFLWIKAAAEEANWRFENALEEYISIYKLRPPSPSPSIDDVFINEEENKLHSLKSSHRADFLNNRIIQCYLNLGRCQEAIEWSEQNTITLNNTLFSSDVNYNYLKVMSTFPDSEPILENSSNTLSWDLNAMYHKSQSNLFSLCISQYNDPNQCYKKQFEDLINDSINPMLNIPIWCSPSVENSLITVLHRNAVGLKSIIEMDNKAVKKALVFSPTTGFSSSNAGILVNAMTWSKIYHKFAEKLTKNNVNSLANSVNELNYVAAKVARKQQNLKLAQTLLLEYAANSCALESAKDHTLNVSNRVNDISSLVSVVNEASNASNRSEKLIKFQLEGAKLIYSFGDSRAAVDALLKCTSNLLSKSNVDVGDQNMEILSRSLLTLVKYLQLDLKYFEHLNSVSHPALSLILHRFDDHIDCEQSLGQSESLILKLLLFSVNNYPELAKSWYTLGAWSYRWGRKLIDFEEDKLEHRSITKEDNAYAFYKLAATSYFKFLQISNHTGCEDVNATLRLLRLILKHAPEMREILEEGLSKTPTEPWKNIILQLFSRLNHHEHYVRQSISDLLCRIGRDSPHLIVFPAVAGSLTNKKDEYLFEGVSTKSFENDTFEDEFDVDSVINEQEEESALMQNCYAALVETLSQQSPQLISQTKTFVHELRRITVLWDEVWIGTLMNHLGEMKKQVTSFDAEVAKIRLNNLLAEEEKELIIREKHNIFFRRVIYFLELTQLITSEAPETPHEAWFQRSFSKAISDTIKSLQSPTDPSEPQKNMIAYQQLLQMIQKKAILAANGRSQLIMDNISPILASFENTVIPMPGLNVHSSTSSNNITIQRVCRTVTTLHTKTKPKKIVFYGSDGKPHTYLFKGHEDLHLDERIMQFLSIVNKMIVKYDNNKQDKVHYRARHYSVTPLGNKSGLIQWVDGGQALYGFYKRWILNRDTLFNNKLQPNHVSIAGNDNVYKPSEIFSKKLASKGIIASNRNEWPLRVLVQVLQELMKETPNDLISKELWCASINTYDYWRLTQTFTYSNAVMSMIGYIIGLGDRHLDNILLDLSTGEVIHIDYNICFEKGKTLRVPEKVSCRLTQNIVNAFGITGIEGTFRMSCEHILRVLRKGKETLLTLLEAFVYDPLIDWTPEHEEGYTGAIYGGARISELAKEGKLISKHQMEKENSEAIVRLNNMIRIIERRNNWPKISDDTSRNEIQPQIQELENIILNDEAIVSASRAPNVSLSSKLTENDSTKKLVVKSSPSVKRNTYATSVWKKVKMKVCLID
jgi:hypothetical protein